MEATKPLRTVVFIDYQNMYRSARRAYGWEGQPGHYGNLKPVAMARILTQSADRDLVQVRVYTGVPTAKKDPHGNAITQRRIAAWVSDYPKMVEVFPRPLRYPPKEGREKGVDVELAIDLVRLAMDDEYEAVVIASADTDLLPPIEFVSKRFSDKAIETAAYHPEPGYEGITAEPLDIASGGITERHKIKKHVFEKAIADRRNFVSRHTAPPLKVEASRWQRITDRFKT